MRRAARILPGCFILFGASSIASGLMRAVGGTGAPSDIAAASPPPPPAYPPPAQNRAQGYDPYAGAALPARR